jgi:hypothetical protein
VCERERERERGERDLGASLKDAASRCEVEFGRIARRRFGRGDGFVVVVGGVYVFSGERGRRKPSSLFPFFLLPASFPPFSLCTRSTLWDSWANGAERPSSGRGRGRTAGGGGWPSATTTPSPRPPLSNVSAAPRDVICRSSPSPLFLSAPRKFSLGSSSSSPPSSLPWPLGVM